MRFTRQAYELQQLNYDQSFGFSIDLLDIAMTRAGAVAGWTTDLWQISNNDRTAETALDGMKLSVGNACVSFLNVLEHALSVAS